MRNLTVFLFSSILAFATFPICAQDRNSGGDDDTEGVKGFWEMESEGGNFAVRLDQISSASRHEYVIDGTVRVYECTVGTVGGLVARFYYIEPVLANTKVSSTNSYNRLKDLASKASEKTGADISMVVTKHYPDTTHAKTSEFRFKEKDTIKKIYDDVYRVWARERGRGKKNKITINE